jgi:ATP-dependent DNA helicase HFM1/MER3
MPKPEKILNDINTEKDGRLLFHIVCWNGKKKCIQTREEKIFLLANDCFTGEPLVHDLSLSQVACLSSVTYLISFHAC